LTFFTAEDAESAENAENETTKKKARRFSAGSFYLGALGGKIKLLVVFLPEHCKVGRMPRIHFLVGVDPMESLIHSRRCFGETSRDQLELPRI
jgi:hypothetical protein